MFPVTTTKAHSTENGLPQTMQELAANAGIRLVVADAKDPENVGFVQWRVAFYVRLVVVRSNSLVCYSFSM